MSKEKRKEAKKMLWIILMVIAVVITVTVGIAASIYTVVSAHEAHVVVQGAKGMRIYSSEEGHKSRYYAVPIVQKRVKLPLRIKQLMIERIPLRDKAIAKFICDVVCWIRINDPAKAAKRIGSQERIKDFKGIEDDITALVKSVTRNSSMKMDLVSIMSDRLKFSKEIAEEIRPSIKEWGIELVDLECIHFHDEEGYTVIADLEQRQAARINSTTRQQVAERKKEADVKESDMERETELTRAANEEKFKKRQMQRDQEVGKAEQQKEMEIEKARQQANTQKVEAKRALEVGSAEVEKEATIKLAEGTAGKIRTEGKAGADVTEMKGTAEATVIERKMTAEATGIDRKADAQKKYVQAGAMAIEIITRSIDAARDIEIAKFQQMGEALQKANVNIVSTGEKDLFGIPASAETGVALGGMFNALKKSGFDVEGVLKNIAATAKDFLKKETETSKKGK